MNGTELKLVFYQSRIEHDGLPLFTVAEHMVFWVRWKCRLVSNGAYVDASPVNLNVLGAGRGNRTPTVFPPADFESAASTNSAIPAIARIIPEVEAVIKDSP